MVRVRVRAGRVVAQDLTQPHLAREQQGKVLLAKLVLLIVLALAVALAKSGAQMRSRMVVTVLRRLLRVALLFVAVVVLVEAASWAAAVRVVVVTVDFTGAQTGQPGKQTLAVAVAVARKGLAMSLVPG